MNYGTKAENGIYYSCNYGNLIRLDFKELSIKPYRCQVIFMNHKYEAFVKTYNSPFYIDGLSGPYYGYSNINEAVHMDLLRHFDTLKRRIRDYVYWARNKDKPRPFWAYRLGEEFGILARIMKNYLLFKLKGL